MTNGISSNTPGADQTLDATPVGLDPIEVHPNLTDVPNPETLVTRVSAVLQPWNLESSEAVSGAIRAEVAGEIEHLGQMTTAQLAWAVAECVVARQKEVSASGDPAAQQGLHDLSTLARMFEHLFLATGGAHLDGVSA
jgi:hypothetical protein